MTPLAAADQLIDRLPEPLLNWVADLILAAVHAANVVADWAARCAAEGVDAVIRWATACTGPVEDL